MTNGGGDANAGGGLEGGPDGAPETTGPFGGIGGGTGAWPNGVNPGSDAGRGEGSGAPAAAGMGARGLTFAFGNPVRRSGTVTGSPGPVGGGDAPGDGACTPAPAPP